MMPCPRFSAILGFAALTLLLTNTAPARAETGGVVIDTYETASGCPTEEAFREEVERRARRPASENAMLRARVRVERTRRGIVGTIALTDAGGSRSTRKVSATGCQEVISTLALIAALAVEESSREVDRPSDAPSPEASSTPVTLVTPARMQSEREATPISRDRGAQAGRAHALRLGAHAAAQSGVMPNVVMTVPVFVEVGLEEARMPSGIGASFEPAVRAAGVFGGTDRTVVGAAVAELQWTSGLLDLCPLRVRASIVSLSPCARVEIGVLAAQGQRIVPARSDRRMWTAMAVPIRVRIEPWPHVFFELEGAARTPFVRDRYVFRPDVEVFEVPALGFTAAAGAGIHFR
jgi:hypothetical protein